MHSPTAITFALPEGLTVGGVTTLSVEICRRLAKLGRSAALIEHRSIYGNTSMDFGLPADVKIVNCKHLAHPDTPTLDLVDYLPAYSSVLPGVVIPNWSYGTFAGCAALAASRPQDVRIIGYAHSDQDAYYKWLTYYETIIHRFIVPTEEIAHKLALQIPHRQEHILVRPNPVDAPIQLERGYSAEQSPIQIVHVARIEQQQKRVYDLVSLAQSMAQAEVDFKLRIIGDGVNKAELYRKIDDLHPSIRQRISLEGTIPLTQLPEVWYTSDISILVSEYEGTSLAMLDSMAHGCVPVMTQVSGTSIIKQGVNGFCVPIGEMDQMAQIIKSLANQRQQLAIIGQQAHTTVNTQLSYEDYLNWFLEVVDQIWQEPIRPWLADRPLLRPYQPPPPPSAHTVANNPHSTSQIKLGTLSGEEIAQKISTKRIIKAMFFKLANKPGLRWLHQFRELGKKVLRERKKR